MADEVPSSHFPNISGNAKFLCSLMVGIHSFHIGSVKYQLGLYAHVENSYCEKKTIQNRDVFKDVSDEHHELM